MLFHSALFSQSCAVDCWLTSSYSTSRLRPVGPAQLQGAIWTHLGQLGYPGWPGTTLWTQLDSFSPINCDIPYHEILGVTMPVLFHSARFSQSCAVDCWLTHCLVIFDFTSTSDWPRTTPWTQLYSDKPTVPSLITNFEVNLP